MKRILMALAACVMAFNAQAVDLKPLRAPDVDAVLAASRGRPQIVEIWSLDCSY